MKKILNTVCLVLMVVAAAAQGYPPISTFSSSDYNAHNRNFGVTIDSSGILWVANFEGLMYYNNATWQIIHTPGYSRVTVVYTDSKGNVWTGGYNYLGKVEIAENGVPYLHQINSSSAGQGEVQKIWEQNGTIKFVMSNGILGHIESDSIIIEQQQSPDLNTDTQPIIHLDNKYTANINNKRDIILTAPTGESLCTISPETGIIADNVSQIVYHKGILWGAGEKSVFALQTPSPYTFFTKNEGIGSTVLTICEYNDKIYASTLQGLIVFENNSIKKVEGFNTACWGIIIIDDDMICATAEGIISIKGKRYTNTPAFSLAKINQDSFYAGCNDGVYLFNIQDNKSEKICPLEKVMNIHLDNNGKYWFQSLYGQIWHTTDNGKAQHYNNDNNNEQAAVVIADGKAVIVKAEDTEPFEYPMYSVYDSDGYTWLTDNSGKNLYCWINGHIDEKSKNILYPIKDWSVRTLFKKDNKVWLGGDEGICIIDFAALDPAFNPAPSAMIRTVMLGDSIVWGGFGVMPGNIGNFASSQRSFKFVYSTNGTDVLGTTLYRYRLNNDAWSNWDSNHEAAFLNLHYGKYKFEVQAISPYGILSNVASIEFRIKYPFYMRWYSNFFYVLLVALMVYAFLRYRTARLKNEKLKLEKTVAERTAEVVCQKNEIEQKSKSLEKALQDLSTAQNELIRQEKMATVGKLTQGLIDRILNPLNYINNFSKLSIGLVGDIEANIEDDKDKMDEENYEDTVDVLQMLKGNLQKVADHGLNTTRTLKAMEEMLKDRTGGMVDTDIKAILKKNEEVVSKYHEQCINKFDIKVSITLPDGNMPIKGNPELLSKTFMSIINNGFYAVEKKAEKVKYTPEISINAKIENNKYIITFYDNGIGIEPTIINKVFDPFFTTKPTSEASGVGLYLSREIVQNHHGDISVKSEKDNYTEFKVELNIES